MFFHCGRCDMDWPRGNQARHIRRCGTEGARQEGQRKALMRKRAAKPLVVEEKPPGKDEKGRNTKNGSGKRGG